MKSPYIPDPEKLTSLEKLSHNIDFHDELMVNKS